MKRARKLMITFAAMLIILFSSSQWAFAKEWDFQTTDDVNKVWKVRFNMPLDQSSLTANSVYVLGGGNPHFTTLRLVDNGYTVEVAPNAAYEVGKLYRLMITSSVQGKNGKALKTPIEVPFQVVSPTAKIQSIYTQSGGIFTNIIVKTSSDVHKVNFGTDEMRYDGNNTFSYALIDVKEGTTYTVNAYDENNRRIETMRYKIGQ
ncbi:Ig-like domain-containing protein [Metabacillus fastidiosus]|uniref:Ig-like domain-containing protein n=1 Tax=Metabacillus fastidiosus TaxID=1458 RepID=UPI002E24ACDD|nr:Ig-like domain-containing protein [Metabacillus fastidiosus]